MRKLLAVLIMPVWCVGIVLYVIGAGIMVLGDVMSEGMMDLITEKV